MISLCLCLCRLTDVGDRGGPAAGGEQRFRHGDGVKGVASGAGGREGAPPPAAARVL